MSLREWAEGFVEIPDDWQLDESSLEMSFGPDSPLLRFSDPAISVWRRGGLAAHKALRLVPHCGVELPGFAEYLVDLDHVGQWPRHEPLSFRVGDTLVRLGAISAGLTLVLEPYYMLGDLQQREFYERLSSLQIIGSELPKEAALSALFYLNADYLRTAKTSARVYHLVDPKEFEKDSAFMPSLVGRKRVRRRAPIVASAAAQLFVAAASEYGESRFLGFYRVLEFFFWRAWAAEVAAARMDNSVSDDALIKKIKDQRSESHQLQAVVKQVLRSAEARMLVRHISYHKLAKCTTIDDVSHALYAHRNAIVHAKEKELRKTRVPDPFVSDLATERWRWIVEYLAVRCIRRLGV